MTNQHSITTASLRRWGYIFALLALSIFLLTPKAAYALICENSRGETVGTDAVMPKNIPISASTGQLLWRSASRSFELRCYENNVGDGPDTVYIYLNPGDVGANVPTLGTEIIWGININGTEYDLPTDNSTPRRVLLGFPQVPQCTYVDGYTRIYEERCLDNSGNLTLKRQTISYYVYAKKGPTAPIGNNYQGPDPFFIFQIDGSGGLNMIAPSYRYYVTGVSQIYFTACGATVNFSPSVVDIGTFFINRATSGAKAGEKNFDVVVQKGNCSDNFKLLAQFDPGSNVELVDNESIGTKMSNGTDAGIKLKLKHQTSSSYVHFGNVSDLVDLSGKPANYIERIPYTVEAFWTKNPSQLETGNISSSATITIFYN
ncbi:hypothetical protein [Leminorella grimontii]|uniref:hypothetical protein n=1 Tax=Leminorella grimontii TaxID=82981 RepID=UPI0020859C22|nr:hypothetical protein [Leminorella grimontii]GKX58954.1 hypothetical protein SOASR031_12690 [Leminorella grimontii]